MRDANLSPNDISGFLFGLLYGAQSNVMWLTYWCLVYTFVDNSRATRLRSELFTVVQEHLDGEIAAIVTMDPQFLGASNFPLLDSLVKETQRLRNNGLAPRFITKDTVLRLPGQGMYKLSAGDIVFADIPFIQRDPAVYSSPIEFDMDRFLEEDGRTSQKFTHEGIPTSQREMIFGGGPHIVSALIFYLYESIELMSVMG